MLGPILSQCGGQGDISCMHPTCTHLFSTFFDDFLLKWGPQWGPILSVFWEWFLGLFWNPLFSFFWENRSPKWDQNGVPFWDVGPSSSVVNNSKISLFGTLDGVPFLGPPPGPLKIRYGSFFADFWDPKNAQMGGLFLGLFLGPTFWVQLGSNLGPKLEGALL